MIPHPGYIMATRLDGNLGCLAEVVFVYFSNVSYSFLSFSKPYASDKDIMCNSHLKGRIYVFNNLFN